MHVEACCKAILEVAVDAWAAWAALLGVTLEGDKEEQQTAVDSGPACTC